MIDFQPINSVNGRIDATLSIADRGLSYGDGLFETAMLHCGVLPYWECHLERLLEGCERLRIDLSRDLLATYLHHLLDITKQKTITDGVVKVVVTRGESGRGYQPSLSRQPTIIIQLHPFPLFPESYYSDGVDVFVCKHRISGNERLAGIKHLNKLDYVLASLEWKDSNYHEALLFDNNNALVEATSRNVFLVKDNQLMTPPIQSAGVAGVMRRLIIEKFAPALSLPVEEKSMTIVDVLNADEIFLCNSIAGIWPVKSILNETQLPQQTVAQQLQVLIASDLQERVECRAW